MLTFSSHVPLDLRARIEATDTCKATVANMSDRDQEGAPYVKWHVEYAREVGGRLV
jgi:hypothetical protein